MGERWVPLDGWSSVTAKSDWAAFYGEGFGVDEGILHISRAGGDINIELGELRICRCVEIDCPRADWSQAPGWAKGHVFDCFGKGFWVDNPDALDLSDIGIGWNYMPHKEDYSGYMLPLGVDWRELIERRPGVGDG